VIDQADIVLVCSQNEAFGRITLEAMLLKKPVIGTNAGGTPELIREGVNGLLYTPGECIELAEKIEYFIRHPEKIREFGENGYEFARKNFTKNGYGGRVYRLLKPLRNEANPLSSSYTLFSTKLLGILVNENKALTEGLNRATTELLNTNRMLESLRTEMRNSVALRFAGKIPFGAQIRKLFKRS
jgi:hypothetical protein